MEIATSASVKIVGKYKEPGESKKPEIIKKHPVPTSDSQTKGVFSGVLSYLPDLSYQFAWTINKPAGNASVRNFTVIYTEADSDTTAEQGSGNAKVSILKIVEIGGWYQSGTTEGTSESIQKTASLAISYAAPAIQMADTTSGTVEYTVESRSANYQKVGSGPWELVDESKTIENAPWSEAPPSSYTKP